MTITICGSIKFIDQMKEAADNLRELGHQVLMPVKADGFCLLPKEENLST